MNERILELAKQAASDYNDANGVFIPDDFVEKFAELIVRECLDVVAGHCGGDPNSEPVKIFLDIEKHFGVEE